uniref:Myb-like domain-containing protein n=1 Tax=Triticum urartu TaxID=4572 RepID=A0A8R7K243_TRIUA
MGQQSKRTCAPTPQVVPPSLPQFLPPLMPHLVPPSAPHLVPPLSAPHLVPPPRQPGPGASIPPQPPKAAAASAPCCLPQTQGPLWYTNVDDLNPEAWVVDSHPPGGFLGFFKNTPSLSQAVSNGTLSQQIKKGDATNGGECARTEKRLLWTKEEDLRFVGAWLNNSNDPIQSNYKKNDQYWNEVAAVYNSTTPPKQGKASQASEGSLWEN